MIIWINGAFGAGKTTIAELVQQQIPESRLYDPELNGSFVSHIVGESATGDFQDLPLWRTLTADLAIGLDRHHDCDLVTPMTVVNPSYFAEIVEPIRAAGIEVHAFTLVVSAAELRRRITDQVLNPDDADDDQRIRQWRLDQVDRCVDALSAEPLGTAVSNEGREPSEVVNEILAAVSADQRPERS